MAPLAAGLPPIGPLRFGGAAHRPHGQTQSGWLERWVEPYALIVFAVMFLYVIFGIPGTDQTDASQTDKVSPLNSWIWLGLLAASMPVLKARWREVLALVRGSWILLALFGYFTLSVTWALDPGACLRRVLFTYVQFFQIAIVLSAIRRPHHIHVVIAMICSLCAVADLLAYLAAPAFTMTDEGFAGLQGQKNQAGLLMMYGYLAAVPCMFLMRRVTLRVFLGGSAIMMAGLLIMTRSTTSQSVVFGATAVIPVLLLIAKCPRSVIQAIAASFTLALFAPLFGFLLWCAVTGADPFLPVRGMTFTARTDIWSFVIDEIAKRPWFGTGYSAFWAIDPAVQPSLKSDGWFSVYVVINEGHNGYLDLLATTGIIGLVSGLFVLFRTIYVCGCALNWTQQAPRAWRAGMITQPTAVFYLAFLLGLILHNFTESNLFSNNGALAVAFLICSLDLDKWRITARATGRILMPGYRPMSCQPRRTA